MHALHWFEIPVQNFERAITFYQSILQVELKLDLSMPGCRMAIFPHDGQHGVGGSLFEHAQAHPNPDGVRIYLDGGPDLADILQRVPAAGGQVVLEKMFLSDDIGSIGLFADSEGNVVGLHSHPAGAQPA